MSRAKGTKNKNTLEPLIASKLSTKERIQFLANLIIDRIIEDQNTEKALYKKFTNT